MAINPNQGIPAPDAQNQQILSQYAAARQNLKYGQNQALDQAQQQVNRNQAISGMSGGTALKENENAARNVNNDYSQQGAALDSAQAGALANVAGTQEAQQFQQGLTQQAQAFTGGQNTQAQAAQAALQSQSLGQQSSEFGQSQAQQAAQFGGTLGLQQQQLAQQQGQFQAGQAQQAEQFGVTSGQAQQQIQQQAQQFSANYNLAGAQFQASQNQFAQQMNYQATEFNANQRTNYVNAITALHSAGISNSATAQSYIQALQSVFSGSGYSEPFPAANGPNIPTPSLDQNGNPNPVGQVQSNPPLNGVLPGQLTGPTTNGGQQNGYLNPLNQAPSNAGLQTGPASGTPSQAFIPPNLPPNATPILDSSGNTRGFVVKDPNAPVTGSKMYDLNGNPIQQPISGKWLCTKLLEKGLISKAEFWKLAFIHATAILRHPNLCFWYLKFGKEMVSSMESLGFTWKTDGKAFVSELFELIEKRGSEAGFQFYAEFCKSMAVRYQIETTVEGFGFPKLLVSKWLWKSGLDLILRRI